MLSELKALMERATPGPWRVELDTVLTKQGGGKGEPMQDIVGAKNRPVARCTIYTPLADGDLIVAAVDALPALVKVAEAAKALLEQVGDVPHADFEVADLRAALSALPGAGTGKPTVPRCPRRAAHKEVPMADLAHSIVGRYGYSGHRKIDVKKHENGYEVEAVFSRKSKRYTAQGADDEIDEAYTKTFVFYTIPEVLDFVRQYLDAPSGAMREPA